MGGWSLQFDGFPAMSHKCEEAEELDVLIDKR